MHPDPRFADDDPEAALAWAHRRGFALIAACTAAGPVVAHAPIVAVGGAVRFHVARANRITPYLDGTTIVATVAGEDGYVSPAWYAAPAAAVPTWDYEAVEIEGRCSAIDEAGLIAQLDALAALHEPRAAPEAPWTRAKLADARLTAMLRAITGFELTVTAIRTTRKLSQNRSTADRDGIVVGLGRSGRPQLAALVRDA